MGIYSNWLQRDVRTDLEYLNRGIIMSNFKPGVPSPMLQQRLCIVYSDQATFLLCDMGGGDFSRRDRERERKIEKEKERTTHRHTPINKLSLHTTRHKGRKIEREKNES